MKIKEAQFPWACCPNCEGDNIHQALAHNPRKDITTKIIRILICSDCGFTLNEGFTNMDIIEKAKEMIAKEIDA